jgi:hypothetical protein
MRYENLLLETLTIPKDTSVGGGAPLLGKHPVYADVALAVRDSNAKVGASIIVDVDNRICPASCGPKIPRSFQRLSARMNDGMLFSDLLAVGAAQMSFSN